MLRKNASYALFPLLFAALAVLLAVLTMKSGLWPAETEAMYPLYCGDFLYRAAAEGNWLPLYDPMWFAGSEPLRHFAPVPALVLAGCQALAGGDNIGGAYVFVGLLFFCSSLLWLWMGARAGRPALGGLLGIVWFLSPYNFYVLFSQGDLARSLAALALPLLLFQTRAYLTAPSRGRLPFFGVFFLLLTLTHPGFAALTALSWGVYLVCWRLICRGAPGLARMVGMAAAGALSAGLWLVPYLTGGALRGTSAEAMAASFQTLWSSLDLRAYWADPRSAAYFALSLLLVCLTAALLARRRSAPEARAALVLLLLSSNVCGAAAQILPGSEVFRGVWLFSAAAALGLLALLNWDTARRALTAALAALLLLSCLPSARMLVSDANSAIPAEERMDEAQTATLRAQAQAVTRQRLAILDEDALGAEGAYLASAYGDGVPIAGGVGRAQSALSGNLTQLGRALRSGGYDYVFDRCLELGCDSVLVQTALVSAGDLAAGLLEQAAARLGYELTEQTDAYRLYHRELDPGWGTVSRYPAIGIGSTAGWTSLVYPAMEETDDTNLNHYTFEQLSSYELVFLSGFTYDDRGAAEDLVTRLSEAGVRVVIAADGIPLDRQTHSRAFLGARCNNIEFSNGYPELDTVDGILNTQLFPPEYADWQTVYVEGLDDVWGYVLEDDLHLPFYGTVKNENIVVVGLNLHYFYSLTHDETVGALLARGMSIPSGRLPEREIVPVTIGYAPDAITVTTDRDGVNTALSAHDNFASPGIRFENGLTIADRGTTVIELRYPDLAAGSICSAAGLALMLLLTFLRRKKRPLPEAE